MNTHPDTASYASAGFGNRIGWGTRPALLLIDVCQAYWTPGSPLDTTASNPGALASIDSMKALLSAAREGGCPVIWTKVEYQDMSEAGIFWLKSKSLNVWEKGDTRGYDQWVDGLVPQQPKEIVVSKHYPSAFFGTDIATRLNLLRVDTLVICGVSTSGCVRASTLDAMSYGFRPMVVGSACGDRSAQIHDANMFDMNAKMADAVTEEEAVAHLKSGTT
ncbi:hypothetical protein A1O1_02861 [Capronia coronata CBS 617.96]|uniref:Isochorismatase-like domain-containing protein n=1 Tax=Capronia coronata CBS 617.96 TaxID=1182541 RepID=W9YXS2_9EURO|nr:uncharacterized protein A1O1_02861 [Capronia coronata CBS 617.96]EXJ94465.1 hypothetical protein A1O1_02861 [Capronia coronata CBS 617.96]